RHNRSRSGRSPGRSPAVRSMSPRLGLLDSTVPCAAPIVRHVQRARIRHPTAGSRLTDAPTRESGDDEAVATTHELNRSGRDKPAVMVVGSGYAEIGRAHV